MKQPAPSIASVEIPPVTTNSPPSLHRVYRDDDGSIGTLGSVGLYVYRVGIRTSHVRVVRALHRALAASYPGQVGAMLVYSASATLVPQREEESMQRVRGDLIELVNEANSLVRACAVVIEADGFLGATLRATAAGVTFAARPRFALRYFADVYAASTWMGTQISYASGARVFEAAVQALRV